MGLFYPSDKNKNVARMEHRAETNAGPSTPLKYASLRMTALVVIQRMTALVVIQRMTALVVMER
jgi:hypothetical protein